MPSSHSNFVLPGLRKDPGGVLKQQIENGFSAAYSLKKNPRRLEAPFYGPWNCILFHLIQDLAPNAWVTPQYTIYDPEDHQPGQEESIVTVEDGAALENTPDFAISCSVTELGAAWQTTSRIASKAVEPVAFIEGKWPASRTLERRDDFIKELSGCFREAIDQIETAALLAFKDKDRKLNRLILMVTSGYWWRFRIMDSENLERADTETNTEDSEPDKAKGKKPARGRRTKGKQRKPPHSDPIMHWALGNKHMEKCWNDHKKAAPLPGTWSKYILYGSKASNQRFYLIHSLIAELQAELSVATLAGDDTSEDDGAPDDASMDVGTPVDDDQEARVEYHSDTSDELLLLPGQGNPGDP